MICTTAPCAASGMDSSRFIGTGSGITVYVPPPVLMTRPNKAGIIPRSEWYDRAGGNKFPVGLRLASTKKQTASRKTLTADCSRRQKQLRLSSYCLNAIGIALSHLPNGMGI